jgi:protocatechuate 3,4-dioxygenase, beta subunit
VGNTTVWEDVKKWLVFLELQSAQRSKYLKVYFVYGNDRQYSKEVRQKELEQIGDELQLKHVALCFVPSFTDTESNIHLSKINPGAENTFIIYRNRNIIDKFINLTPTDKNFRLLANLLDTQQGDYFNLD